MGLRLASKETIKIDLGEDAWVEVLTEVSKGDFNKLVAAMPSDLEQKKGLTPSQGTQFQTAIFETLVKSWSLDAPLSVESYLALDREDASALDDKLAEHFNKLTSEPDAPKGSGRKR